MWCWMDNVTAPTQQNHEVTRASVAYHVDTGGRFAEDDEVRHSQRSCDGHKVLKHVLLLNLRPKQTV